MSRKLIGIILKLAVTAGLFVLLFRPQTFGLSPDRFGGITPKSLWQELTRTDLSTAVFWLSFALVMKLTGIMAGVARWRLLLRGQGLSIPFWYTFQSWFVGRMIGIFTPGTIGLDGYRFYDASLYTKEPIKNATVIAVEKLIGFISLTFLVFMTFPLGFRILKIKVALLAFILTALAMFVIASFLLLLNPRVIQVLVAVIPTPAAIRNKIDKLGAAITAYSGKRLLLLAAVACGVWVHLATCIMFFGTMMAIRTTNTNLLDILFASPLMIYGTVIGPSVGGEGIREIVFGVLLGGKSSFATAVLFAHLGWWVGEFTPFLIGVPIFLLRSRPSKTEIQDGLAAAREQVARADTIGHLSPWAVVEYRAKLVNTVLAGAGAGLMIGAASGLIEAFWIKASFEGLTELSAFWWGPLVYGLVFMGVGIGAACGLAFLYLLLDRFAPTAVTFGLTLAAASMAGCGIGVWRFLRDILARHTPTMQQMLSLAAIAVGASVLIAVVGGMLAHGFPRSRVKAAVVTLALYLIAILGGLGYARMNPMPPRQVAFQPAVKAAGPNMILIVSDALRADYLDLYSKDAVAKTPKLDAFAHEAVTFDQWYSQASWTKPAFATLFSGLYPESHTATSQAAMLPDGVVTFPALLSEAGYFTKGFSNNPNICTAFNFGKGFTDYVDLKPRLYFAANYSASRLALYEVLRHVWEKALSKVYKKIDITHFYQPAEVVTHTALEWLDSAERPKDAPFFLFLHYMDTHDPFMDYAHPGVGYARVRMQRPDPTKFLDPMKAAYNSDIEHLDQNLGALFEGLRQRGFFNDAVVMFTADHGEEFYDHEGWWHGQTVFDELIHVPALLKLPQQQKAGTNNTSFARHIDLGPTLLHFAGAVPDPSMPGKSMIGNDGAFTNGDIVSVYAENDFENNVMQTVRTDSCKVIHANPDNARHRAPVEVYDVAKDLKEKQNIAGQNHPCESTLDKQVTDMHAFTQGMAAEPSAPAQIDKEREEQLKGLGYLGTE